MQSFREFFEDTEFVDFVINEFNGVPSLNAASIQPAGTKPKQKMWSAKKPEIIQMWKNMRSDVPIILTPMSQDTPASGEKSSYGEDGIRITGSWQFISAVLSRLKEIIAYENPQTKLRLVLRAIDKARDTRLDRQSYVFYVNLERRSYGKAGRPKKVTNAIV